ncbi:methionine aminotransferase [Sphingobacterium hungaricum]|uniref:Methionine aminotransferase n=1 Tax=Sphingobacterium hungaricum TaxID=2082723 RepID=A0A928UZR7_9SPHI|nr:methionine aminotransferase [Sphingobacterium hungaricum]MBE8714054.1 methionine aminotransferase [Sphingobacterium hungaricum]
MTNVFQKLRIFSKLPDTQASIFSIMSECAAKENAINLSQGFPDFDCDPKLISFVNQYMTAGNNQYAPMAGLLSLRETIAEKVNFLYQKPINPDLEITITAGGTQAIFTTIAAVIQTGDEVIIFEPAYDSYRPTIELFGGKVVAVKLKSPEFKIDWEEVKSLFSERTKLMIINNPNNPSGKCLTKEDVLKLEDLVEQSNCLILSDEVYEHLVFDGRKHLSLLSSTRLAHRTFVIASFGKLIHATGWKIGYVIAPTELMIEFRKVHQFLVFSVNTPIQYAINDYLKDRNVYLQLNDFFQKKRDFLLEGLSGSRLKAIVPEGTYFLLADYSDLSEEKELTFAKRITSEYKVATIPVSAFYKDSLDQQVVRLCFAKKQETLEKAIENLIRIK